MSSCPQKLGKRGIGSESREENHLDLYRLRWRRAVLQPVLRAWELGVLGRIMSVRPSKSVGAQSYLCVRNSIPCSLLLEWTSNARPSLTSSVVRCQSRSRILADGLPTKVPGAISNSHLVRSPRRPAGHAVTTKTIMVRSHVLTSSHQQRSLRARSRETVPHLGTRDLQLHPSHT